MKTNNNSQQIKPYKFKATVEIIGKPNHPYNHVIWIDSVTRTTYHLSNHEVHQNTLHKM